MNPFKTVFAVLLLSTFAGGGVAADLETYATGLNNPRGLKFGPDRDLYVAEGGTTVGSASTVGLCDQVPFPVGPYTGGFTSRISRIDALRVRHTVIDGLPSSRTGPILGNLVSGVADIAFLNGVLYGIEAGCRLLPPAVGYLEYHFSSECKRYRYDCSQLERIPTGQSGGPSRD